MAKAREEIVTEHIGINVNTLEVESVSEWRSGKMTGSHGRTHHAAGLSADNELVIVFSLSDTFSYPVQMWDAAWVKQRRQELEVKAASMRETKAAKS